MNFFKLYIGDYQRDTAHLSIAEHGAYLLMLQHYYATEKPLPVGRALHRMLRAQSKEERDAIDVVSEQFWSTTEAGLVNARADDEITKANTQADTNARIAREREERRRATRKEHEQSTNRATNDQPNQTPDTRLNTKEPTALVISPSGETPDPNVVKLADRRIPCPCDRLIEVFHAECPTLPRVMKLTDARRKHLTARWREVDADAKLTNADEGIEIFRAFFRKVSASDFLSGKGGKWAATFDWLIESSGNFMKTFEGNYDNDRRAAR